MLKSLTLKTNYDQHTQKIQLLQKINLFQSPIKLILDPIHIHFLKQIQLIILHCIKNKLLSIKFHHI